MADISSSDLEQVRQLMLSGYKWIEPGQKSFMRRLAGGLKFFQVQQDGPSFQERRRSVRMYCHYQVSCIHGLSRFEGLVVDVGLSGLRLEAAEKLPRNLSLRISPREGGQPIPCRVRWSRRSGAHFVGGLSFELKPTELVCSWVAVLLAAVGFNEEAVYQRRTAVRAPADLPAQVRTPEEDFVHGKVLDLGVGGALVQVQGKALKPVGTHRLALGPYKKLEMLTIAGQVVRILPRESENRWNVGIRFVDPSSAQVRLLGSYVLDLLTQGSGGA